MASFPTVDPVKTDENGQGEQIIRVLSTLVGFAVPAPAELVNSQVERVE